MKQFLKRILKFFFIPILILILVIIGYFVYDPLNVLYFHDSYSHTHGNRDYYTIENFNKRYPTQKYNSFIFGSSRTLAYQPESWAKFLEKDARPYMMDGYAENIYGIYRKMKYLDSLNVDIKNVLIILDVNATFVNTRPIEGYLYSKHPLISGENPLKFQWEQFSAYMNPNFTLRYYLFRLGGVKNQFVYDYVGNIRASVDSITNGLKREDLDKQIRENPNYHKRWVFYHRADQLNVLDHHILDEQYKMLVEIANIFKKRNTDYKIIIGPDYDQSVYCPEDKGILNKLFGAENIYDFSGKNKLTESKYNYYENSHYRPFIGDTIMSRIYRNKTELN